MPAEAIVIAANFTADPVKESLAFWLGKLELPLDVLIAPYDQVFQQLLDPSSLMARNTSGINILLLKLDDWTGAAGGIVTMPNVAVLERNIDGLVVALRAAVRRTAVPYMLVLCPSAPEVLPDSAIAMALARAEDSLRSTLLGQTGLSVVAAGELMAAYPVESYYDAASRALGQIPYSSAFFAALGTFLARHLHAARNTRYKVLVLDCDNTLWKGVCGEVGSMGVVVDDSMRAFQQFVVRQHEAGMLLCLCSKNNEADVAEVFANRPDMPLAREQIVSSRINWRPKSENLRSLAAELNLGLDSFVFVDDSPFEIAEVRARFPEVLALQVPPDADGVSRFMKHCWAFDRTSVTAEDRNRAASYQDNTRRDGALKQAANLEDFLQSLDLQVEIEAPAADDFTRAAQMTQRTNQFNASTIRRTEAEVRRLCEPESMECRLVRVRDRFGDYGIVGLVTYHVTENVLRVDSFLLSCRALGRRVEHRMLAELGEIAQRNGAAAIEIPFVRTARNTPVLEFLNSLRTTTEPVVNDHVFALAADDAVLAPTLPFPARQVEAATDSDVPRTAVRRDNVAASQLMTQIFTELTTVAQIDRAVDAARQRSRPSLAQAVVTPRSESERRIVEIWKQALHLDDVGVHDNFFDLGGTSLVAVPMFASLGREMGAELSPYLLFQAPTIAQLAALLAHPQSNGKFARPGTSLVPIRPEGSRPPLFLVHAGAGSILFYYPLASALEPDQPVYGLQAQGLGGLGRPHGSVEEMAAHYVAEVQRIQPHGPYQLAGFCFGATLAFEMAQQLHRRGEDVGFLGSFDGVAPAFYARPGHAGGGSRPVVAKRIDLPAWTRLLPASFARTALYQWDMLRRLEIKERPGYLVQKARSYLARTMQRMRNRALRAYADRTGRPVPVIFRHFRWYFHVNNAFARRRYAPAEYPGKLTVFTIAGRYAEPNLGWPRWAKGGVTTIEIPGEFRGHRVLLYRPMVMDVAKRLTELLAGGAARATPEASEALAGADRE